VNVVGVATPLPSMLSDQVSPSIRGVVV